MTPGLPNNLEDTMPIIAILRGILPTQILPVCEVLLSHKIRWIEIPLNSPEPFESISLASKAFAAQAIIGAGTVLTSEDVSRLGDIGARLIVAPNTDADVIHAARQIGMTVLPGAMTPTEVLAAERAGASGVKLFPARSVGRAHLKDIKAVIPSSFPVVAVGGVDAENIRDWLAAGASAVGVGTSIFEPGDTPDNVSVKAGRICEAMLRD